MTGRMKVTFISLLVVLGMIVSFGAGCIVMNSMLPGSRTGIGVVQEAWNIIFSEYVEPQKLDAQALSGGAIQGILDVLKDPHSSYLDPSTYKLSSQGLQGSFQGIGAQVGIRDNKIQVIAPIPNSPAAKAGIKAGDFILAVDGQSTEGMSVEKVVLLIRGPKGTPVKLSIQHQDEEQPVDITIVRDDIALTSVAYEMRGATAYIIISQFSERTDQELGPVMDEIAQKGATGIVLDLRNNPGGMLDTVVEVASRFIKDGAVLHVVDNQGNKTSLTVNKDAPKTDLPMVVLVNSYSASGSEVLTGALQDYQRATVAGNTTYGKGSVNRLHQLSDGSGLYITTARWLTPNGRLIEGKGLDPDIKLELEGDAAVQWAIDYLNKK